jgi:hypothetical protein
MYRVLIGMFYLYLSVHYDYRGGQSNFECSYPVPSKKQKIHISINVDYYLLTPSVSMFIEGLSLEACHAAQAERRSANTATAPASVAAAAAAERALSASPPFFALSPPAEMDSIASPPTPRPPMDRPLPSPVVWRLLSMLRILSKGGGGGAVARWRGDGDVRVLASARGCCRRRGEDATINIRW